MRFCLFVYCWVFFFFFFYDYYKANIRKRLTLFFGFVEERDALEKMPTIGKINGRIDSGRPRNTRQNGQTR